MDVVSVPKYDSNKMRSCAYFPVATLESYDEATFLETGDVLELADDYMVEQVARLEEMVSLLSFIKDVSPTKIIPTQSALVESQTGAVLENKESVNAVGVVVDHMATIASTLKKRVVKI